MTGGLILLKVGNSVTSGDKYAANLTADSKPLVTCFLSCKGFSMIALTEEAHPEEAHPVRQLCSCLYTQ